MARELLTEALVGGRYAAAPKDPALLPAYRKQTLAQALIGQGLDSGPAYPAQALGRLAQAIAGSYLMNQGNDEIGAYTAQRKADTADALKALMGPVTAPAATMVQPTTQAPPTAAQPSSSMKPYVPQNLPPGISPEEDILTRTVIGEAGGEPPVGQRAVASVIRNRINQSGGNISDVVFAPNQFEPWNNATVRAKLEGLDPASPQYQAALANVRADGDDPTGGATHFYSPKAQAALGRQPPSWANTEPSAVIGNHNFYSLGYAPGSGAPGAPPARTQVASAGNVATDASPEGPSQPSVVSGAGVAQPSAPAAVNSPLTTEGMTRLQRAIHVATLHPDNEAIQEAAKLEMENARTMILQGRHEESLAAADAARKEARQFHLEDLAHADANRVPHTITMQDPDNKGIGIYTLNADGTPGKRIGNAPKQPGEGGPFTGTAMDAQANNVLLSIGPKVKDNTATENERGQYALAYEHLSQGRIMPVPDPSDPTGQRQVLARIPGAVPPQFPAPPGAAPSPVSGQPEVAGPPAAPSAGAPSPSPTGQPTATPAPGAPVPIPGTVKAAPPTTDTEKTAAGFALRTREAGKVLNDLEARGIHSGNTGQALLGGVPAVGNFLTSPDYQVYQQQMQDWVRAKLRRESGAVIGKDEMADEIKTYFPQPGDTPEKIAAKRKSREAAQRALEESAGRARIESAPAAPSGAIPPPPPGFKVIP